MDIEQQIAFLDTEIKKYNEAVASLQEIKDTISGLVAPQLASIAPLVVAKETAEARVVILEAEKVELTAQVKDLTPESVTKDSGTAEQSVTVTPIT